MTKNSEKGKIIIGLPQALLYHRYGALWQSFFHILGCETLVSEPTSRATVDAGERLAPDESCLSLKIFLGHVSSLVGKCDYIFVPRVANFGRNLQMCIRFEALPDLTRCLFAETGQKFLTCSIDEAGGSSQASAFRSIGTNLGYSAKESGKAWKAAEKEYRQSWEGKVKAQEKLYHAEGMKILVVGHSYLLEDPYVGGVILKELRGQGVLPLRADITDRDDAIKRSTQASPTCRWCMSRELIGSVRQHIKQVDGVVMVEAFSCGPDSMVNEILRREITGVPVLQLVVDSQSGTAGVETRIESFVDIIRMKKGMDV